MAKFLGNLGVVTGYKETIINGYPSGVYEPIIETYNVSGDILSNSRSNNQGSSINDNLTISNRFSILATPYLVTLMSLSLSNEEALTSLYLEVYGQKWKVTGLELQLPRVYITIGGVWNEETN